MTSEPARPAVVDAPARGTAIQRLRVRGLELVSWLACRLPERSVAPLGNVVGWVWYKAAPERAAQARRNLGRVVAVLDGRGEAQPRIQAAARDPRALERLVVSAFRHDARYYLEVLRVPSLNPAAFDARVVIETPDAVEAAFAGGPVIFVSAHLGPIELPGLYLAHRSGRTFAAPMETVDDPPLQAWFERTRGSLGVRIVGLKAARRALQAALIAGEPVGIVADRDIAGGGLPVVLFGAPAPLPIGPALFAIESGASLYAVGVRRLPDGRVGGRLLPVAVATAGTRRERIAATLRSMAAAFESLIGDAPDQWSAVFFPLWPDLAPGGSPGGSLGGSPEPPP
ncbi:MAG: phosphatidylinositol dimannoside acyltransferase [Chloroflexota bacterium]|jgi:KDO2-lipid IV(A) lauroyltransferase|nr:phosphatidylinositol dimannoside acyltransferase [Chloroflexota bacterium]